MRISSTMMSNNYLKQLNGTYENYSKLFEQSDGSKLHRASDDAVGYSKYLRFQNNKTYNEQYQANVSTAVSWMKNADAAMVNVTDLLQTFKAKVEQSANSSNNESDMKDIAKELLASVQEQVAAMNTQIGDRFLFAGQKDTTMPFEISSDKMERGDTFTLDEQQSAFFSGSNTWGAENTTVKQMLQLTDADGNNFYMNVNTGDIFTEDFIKNGYKNEESFDPETQRVGCIDEFRPNGQTMTLSKNQASYFGTDTLTQCDDGNGNIYWMDAKTGNVYEDQFVTADWATATDAADNHKQGTNFATGNYFDNRGVLQDVNNKTLTLKNADGTTTDFSLSTTKQYIVTYSGDDKYISMVKKNGGVDQATDTVNVTGQDIWGSDLFDVNDDVQSGTAMLNQLLYSVAKLDAGDYKWASEQGMTIADSTHASVLGAETKMAARRQAYDASTAMLTTQNESITSDITDVSSTDVAYLATQLMQYQTIYSLSLSVGAKILPGTLADYLS